MSAVDSHLIHDNLRNVFNIFYYYHYFAFLFMILPYMVLSLFNFFKMYFNVCTKVKYIIQSYILVMKLFLSILKHLLL